MIEFQPVLLPDGEIEGNGSAFGYPVQAWDDAIEATISNKGLKDGALEAAELMLQEAAVAVFFVNYANPGRPIREGEEPSFRGPEMLLGFNDHGGGSESNYKILLNLFSNKVPAQYVLYSPPEKDGSPSNTTFHCADFGLPVLEPQRIVRQNVPNVLKTCDEAMKRRRDYYEFYLVGQDDAPQRLVDAFTALGFDFLDTP
jgi:hypothetical protein